jgi:hypothetical protein
MAALAVALGGCAHASEQAPPPRDRLVLAVDDPPATAEAPSSEVTVAEATDAASRPRTRLSKTVTLGQTEAYAPAPPPPSYGAGGGPGVVVNNNVTVVTPPPVYYGGFGGYGYGGYGYGYGGYGAYGGAGGRGARFGGAGYGGGHHGGGSRTPPVAGDWPAPPSYGPRTMK